LLEAEPSIETILARRTSVRMVDRKLEEETFGSQLARFLRMIRRLCKLAFVFTPVVALYPLHWITSRTHKLLTQGGNSSQEPTDAHELALQTLMCGDDVLQSIWVGWYWQLCLYCVEWSGAACIKIMQWAGSRPDMFGREFCSVFSRLQDSTTPHAWKHTEAAMKDAYGDDWQDQIRLEGVIGSGCIAQVYKGAILPKVADDKGEVAKERPIAVKVMHPCVEDDIDADLDILRMSIRLLENFGPIKDLKWLNLPGFIEEMAIMLKTQLDLRKEGEHLVRFNENFAGNPVVVFPKVIDDYQPTRRVLCETYMDGVPLLEFVKTHRKDQKMLTVMCNEAIRAVCQMIFLGECVCHG